MLKKLLTAAVGTIAFNRDPVTAGLRYLKQSVAGFNDVDHERVPDGAYRELAENTFKTAELMQMGRRDEKVVTIYVELLEICANDVANFLAGESDEYDKSTREVLARWSIS